MGLKSKVMAVLTVFAALALVPASASAAIPIDAKDFTEPIETQMTAAVPIVVGFIAVVFAVTFVVRWIQRRASSAR